MLMPFLRASFAALAMLVFSATAHAETLKDIRKVSVAADASVSPVVRKLTAQQLQRAARSTRRPVAVPRVVMDVRLSNEVRGGGAQVGRNSADVTVVLRDGSGAPVSSERFTVNSFMTGNKAADRALANAIAQRVAIAYSLAPVRAAPVARNRPAKAQRPHRTASSKAAASTSPKKPAAAASEPVIIPSEAALTVRPRVRKPKTEANANAGAVPAPCVVTATTRCN
ncbi:hypothetical protein [Rhizobium subbaraonis]|nr:hypothetical protein [Rhizobium subbaraonis]